MKLNSDLKERVKTYLKDRAFSYEKRQKLEEEVRNLISQTEFFKERKRIYDENPEYIRGTSFVSINREVTNEEGKYLEKQVVQISLKNLYATKVDEWGTLTFSLDKQIEKIQKYPGLHEAIVAFMDFDRNSRLFRMKLNNILAVTQSSSPLVQLFPELSEFFNIQGKIKYSTSLLNTKDLEFVNQFLAPLREEGGRKE